MSDRQSLTINRRRLAATLRRLREQANLAAGLAARQVDHDQSWLSRIESAEVRPHPNDVRALLTLYGVPDDQVAAIITVARQTRQRDWWQRYRDVLPDWFVPYLGLEAGAAAIRMYECHAVPGPLRIPEYTRAIFRASPVPAADEQLERRVTLWTRRQEILGGENPPPFAVVLHETVLRRVVGDQEILAAQLSHLVAASQRPKVDLRLLPFDAPAGYHGSFQILDFPALPAPYPDSVDEQLVYVETLADAMYLDRPEHIAPYNAAFGQLQTLALSPETTRDVLRSAAEQLSG